jgi:hypothetical protein
MMEQRQILDFVIIVGNNVDDELETYKILNIMQDPKHKNGRVLLTLQARDVPIRKSGGWYFFNLLTGRHHVVGSLDLERKREVSIAEDLFLQIKVGKPNVFLAFADERNKLPKGFKDNPLMDMLWDMFFAMRKNKEEQAEMLREAGMQQSEIQDLLTQSQTRLQDYMKNYIQSYNAAFENQIKSGGRPGPPPPPEEQKKGGFY